jgi:hypothetical protein
LIASSVTAAFGVLTAINLYDKTLLTTGEVRKVSPNRHLANELDAI